MAIGHIAITVHQRCRGHSVAAALAYRHGIDLRDIRSDKLHRFSARGRRDEIAAAGFTHGATAPAWRLDAQSFADALEIAETRVNSCIARDVQCALPHELPEPDRIALAQTWAELIAARYDAPVAYAVHRPDRRADTRNAHLHVLLPTRSLSPDGSLGRKLRQLDDRSTGPTEIKVIRSLWQVHCNTALKDAGLAIRIDTGRIRPSDVPPTPKVGPAATQFERDAAAKSGTAPGASIAETVVTEPECATAAGAELRRHVIAHQPDLAVDAAEVAGVEITLLEEEQAPAVPAQHKPRNPRAPRAARDPRQREASKRVRLARKALEQTADDSALQAALAAAKDAQAALRVELRGQRETRSSEIDRAAADGLGADTSRPPELAPPEAIPLVPRPVIPAPPEAALAAPDLLTADPPTRLVSPAAEPSSAIDIPSLPLLGETPPPPPLPPFAPQALPPAPELLSLERLAKLVSPPGIPVPPEADLAVPNILTADPPTRLVSSTAEPSPAIDIPSLPVLEANPPAPPLPPFAPQALPPAPELLSLERLAKLVPPPGIPEPPEADLAVPNILTADPPTRLVSPTAEPSPAIDIPSLPILDPNPPPGPLPKLASS